MKRKQKPAPDGIPADIWNRRRLLPRRNSPRRETHVPILCPRCNQERWLKTFDAKKAIAEERICGTCHAVDSGRAGYRVTVRKLGRKGILELIAKTQREKPSRPELVMMELLDEALPPGFEYKTQVVFSDWIIDFVVLQGDSTHLFIEVNGYHHKLHRGERDKALQMCSMIPVIFIDADDLRTDEGKLHTINQIHERIRNL